MPLTLEAMLDLRVFTRARAELLTGRDELHREVRWVHTSEIYDIASLLKGGEVLLTTGLGLVGATSPQLRRYVDGLADRSLTALLIELGRTFPAVPDAVLEQARQRRLPVIALHGVIPFVEVTETVHALLVHDEVEALRRADQVTQDLVQILLTGGGLQLLVERIGQLAGCPARLVADDGRVVAVGGDERPAARSTGFPVTVYGNHWGQFELDADDDVDCRAVGRAGVTAIELELARGAGQSSGQARRQLLLDIVMNRFGSAAELSSRAAGVGLSTRAHEYFVAVCLGVEGRITPAAINAAAEASRRAFGWSFVANLGSDVLVVGRTSTTAESALRALLSDFAQELDRQLAATTGGRAHAVAAGYPVADAPALVGAFATAREISGLARHLGGHRPVLLPSDLGVQRLLARLVRDPELERFVDAQLGPLLEHDSRRGRELMTTLDAYLDNELSKTRTAEALGIRRQTLYRRLERLDELLGDFRHRDRRISLELALAAWRLRTTASNRT